MTARFDICPARPWFRIGEPVVLLAENGGPESVVRLAVSSPEDGERVLDLPLGSGASELRLFTATKAAGYGVRAFRLQDGIQKDAAFTAFEVCGGQRPFRYGFLSDFNAKDIGDDDVLAMLRLHVTAVQFYDWSYRHDSLLPPSEVYKDMMGKEISAGVVKRKIAQCHERGMLALGYAPVYAASKAYRDARPGQGLYNGEGKPLCFIGTFYYMNLASPWRAHVIRQYAAAMEGFGFDGVHMDAYGWPKEALDADGRPVRLRSLFPRLIEETRAALPGSCLVFNNVGGWPVEATRDAPQDAVYIEVWPPDTEYRHLAGLIQKAAAGGKPVVLAAYPAFFKTAPPDAALEGELLLSFVIAMHGASQLCFGEKGVLTGGYYSDYSLLSSGQFAAIRNYQDFFVHYWSIMGDRALSDVSRTHCGGDNREYVFSPEGSAEGEGGRIWYHIRQNDSRKAVFMVNLANNNAVWNEAKNPPLPAEVLAEIQVPSRPRAVWAASPDFDHGRRTDLDWVLIQTGRSAAVRTALPLVRCAMVVVEI